MKGIYSKLRKLIKTNGKKAYIYGMFYSLFIKFLAVKKNTILIESMLGLDFTGNPLSILKEICSDLNYAHYKIFVVCPKEKEKNIIKLLNRNDIKFLRKDTIRYSFYLASVEYLINDVTFPIYFCRRKEQYYLNTWHGTPIKTLGRQLKNGTFLGMSNTSRNFMHTTLLLAPNEYTKDIFERDYMLKNIWSGRVLIDGYPRNDILYLNKNKNKNKNKKINIVFMPTWRGVSNNRTVASQDLVNDLDELLEYLDKNLVSNMILWVKLHPLVNRKIVFEKFKNIKEISLDVDLYDFISNCDALITDYSSILFDFTVTDRPIIIYGFDIENYENNRGLYFNLCDLPFVKCSTKEELLKSINELSVIHGSKFTPSKDYLLFKEKYCKYDDGNCSARICDLFFNKKEILNINHENKNKTKILIYVGPLFKNGIVTSFKNFISLLDTEKYDITILADTKDDVLRAEDYFGNLPFNIKFIPFYFKMYASPLDFLRFTLYFLFKKDFKVVPKFLERIFKSEFKRIFGDAKFDLFVNYNGYSWKMALFSIGMDFPKVVYVHNEMDREISANRVADKRLLELSYILANKVVVVREGIHSNYCAKYYDYSNKMHHIPNPLLPDIIKKSQCDFDMAFDESVDVTYLNIIKNALDLENTFRFVNVARFSPEKGHFRLIDAFDVIWMKNNNCQLYIIAGHGVLENEIKSYILSKKSRDSIFIIIGSSNPFPIVKRMNSFVLSSFYEGLPMVIFEMLQLDIPIISTNIPGPAEFLNQGYGLVVDNSIDGLIYGMEKALNDEIPTKEFDFEKHNEYALNQFYSVVKSVTKKT